MIVEVERQDDVSFQQSPVRQITLLSATGDSTDITLSHDALILDWQAGLSGAQPGPSTVINRFTFPDFYSVISGGDLFTLLNAAEVDQVGTEAGEFLEGFHSDDTLNGAGGDDRILGFEGDDFLIGGTGDDTLIGGVGAATLSGGQGNDVFVLSSLSALDWTTFTELNAGDMIKINGSSADYADFEISNGRIEFHAAGSRYSAPVLSATSNLVLVREITTVGTTFTVKSSGVSITTGDDLSLGTDDPEEIDALAGNDTIRGLGGNDTLLGNDGFDLIEGGAGNDSIFGGNQGDTIIGGDGNDTVDGGNGRDNVTLNQGNDVFNDNDQGGDAGRDTVNGGLGDDTINGGAGADEFAGGDGFDLIFGGLGFDLIFGGNQADTIRAGAGDDTVFGGNGRDEVFLNQGADVFNDNTQGGDAGRDTVFAGNGFDTINGGGGDDAFYGGNGNDSIFGGGGADLVFGGNGQDSVDLGAGDDRFVDTDQGGDLGRDTVTGGAGADTFVFGTVISTEVITDFELGVDTLELASGLVGGLDAAQVAAAGEVTGQGVLLSFGAGQSVLLEGMMSTVGLGDDIDII
ncbi:calcium-binding protein [uncultured Tateyamaria sp.]|uniref:calcium-binding protein n=1 Tax=uncultured Tateyamaria sp. TaxID=455651 RepID=UPI0026097EB6|nr:calcium-binding protein [uncultured Tateyamaria sp.]